MRLQADDVFPGARLASRSAFASAPHPASAPSSREADAPLVLSAREPDRVSRIAAGCVLAVSLLFFMLLAPNAKLPLPPYPIFIPLNQTVLVVNDLLTAMLLFAQLRVTRSRATLVLACGYVFSALMAIVHLLTFPGVFSPGGLLGGGAQTTGYLFVFWHAGFALFVIGYALSRRHAMASGRGQVRQGAAPAAFAVVLGLVLGLALLATLGNDLFPPMLEAGRYTSTFNVGRYGQWFLVAAAIVVLWRTKPRSILDQWLLVALCAMFIEIALVGIFNGGRYDLGFYSGRVYALLSSCFVLGILFLEQARMYSGLLPARETARSEAELRKNREVLRLAMQGARMGAWSIGLPRGEVWWSAELEQILRQSPCAAGRSVRRLLRCVHREDIRALRGALRSAVERGEDFSCEIRFLLADGEWRWLAVRGQATVDAGGGLSSLFGIAMDIHERRRGEEAVRQIDARFQMLADGIPQLAWMARADGTIYWYNRRWYDYTGSDPASVDHEQWHSTHDPAVLPAVRATWQQCIETGRPFEMVCPLRAADGRYRTFLTRASPFRNADGEVLHWFGTHTDITAQRELELALRTADRRKDEFLATVVHELRNPLSPIRTAVALSRRSAAQPQQLERAWQIVDRQSLHLSRMVDDLMEVARVTQRKVQLRMAPVSILEALQDALEATRPAVEAARHELVLRLPEDPLLSQGDATRITQVFSNLIVNASKFTPPGGTIRVTAERVEDFARVTVRDTGIGIPAEHLHDIFGIFSQVQRTVDKSLGGLGIGLALVRGFVELHGGEVRVSSEGEGRGSEFTVLLPLADRAGTMAAGSAQKAV